MRRKQTQGSHYTAGDLTTEEGLKKLTELNDGFQIFSSVRNSPAYFSRRKKDCFAMIRQLGLPSWFMSLSAAETKWISLLRSLGKLVDKKTYSDEYLLNMDWEHKSRLIKSDPILCARFFDNRVNEFINTVLKSPHFPIGQVEDLFLRVEFQQRGSPHIHMLVWLKDAPKYEPGKEKEIQDFVDKYISCSLDVEDDELDYVNVQKHRHSKTCRKRGKAICRFGFPKPPMRETKVLTPLDDGDVDVKLCKQNYANMAKEFDAMVSEPVISFDKVLERLDMTYTDYENAIRSSIKTPTVFLKRQSNEGRVNNYMKNLLKGWCANHDIQFVLDPYACAVYVADYMNKSQKGMSALLERAAKDARNGHMDAVNSVRHIGNQFINSVETGAQEAAYLVLGLPIVKCSREVVFINTSPPDERTFLVKSKAELEKLDPNSEDIESDNFIKRYARRPKELENVCLADYVALFNVNKIRKEKDKSLKKNCPLAYDDDEEENFLDDPINTSGINLTTKDGYKITRRTKSKVIRSVGYSKSTEPENHFRELLMLYLPWRDEIADLLKDYESYQTHYYAVEDVILPKLKNYQEHADILEEAQEALANQRENDDDDDIIVAPDAQYMNALDEEMGSKPSDEFSMFDPNRQPGNLRYDIAGDLRMYVPQDNVEVREQARKIPDDEYFKKVNSLNEKQRIFYNHVMKCFATDQLPVHLFLTGGAGVGKSVTIETIYQGLLRMLCSIEGEDPDCIRIMLTAYTGKAARHIGGIHIHKQFNIGLCGQKEVVEIGTEKLTKLGVRFRKLKVVVIDEISLVSNRLFNIIDVHLRKIVGNNEFFGGHSVIVVGDLYQLKPIGKKVAIYDDIEDKTHKIFKPNYWKNLFYMFELDEIMRQKDDLEFASLLNRLRLGEHTSEDIETLKTRMITEDDDDYWLNETHLCATNATKNAHNNKLYNLSSDEKTIVTCIDSVIKKTPKTKKTSQSKTPQSDTLEKLEATTKISNTGNLMSKLPLSVNARYDLTVNTDVDDGLYNGSECVLKLIDYRQDIKHPRTKEKLPCILWVEYDEDDVGNSQREKYKQWYTNDIHPNSKPVFQETRTFNYSHNTIKRRQFPLQPSAAKTIHRSQGHTLDKAVLNFECQVTIPHLHYTGFSRVRKLSDLQILSFDEKKIKVDEDTNVEMERLRSERPLNLSFTPVKTLPETSFKIIFQNAQSLHKHFACVQSDNNFLYADVLAFAQTRFSTDDDDTYKLPSFKDPVRCDKPRNLDTGFRSPHGSALYVKDNADIEVLKIHGTSKLEYIATQVSINSQNIQIVSVYKIPSCTLNEFKNEIVSIIPYIDLAKPLVILGDFNFDLQSYHNQFLSFMERTFNSNQSVHEVTTKYGTTLDLVFSNLDVHSEMIFCPWSDHYTISVHGTC